MYQRDIPNKYRFTYNKLTFLIQDIYKDYSYSHYGSLTDRLLGALWL